MKAREHIYEWLEENEAEDLTPDDIDYETKDVIELMESYRQSKSKEYVKSPLRDIISDVMDEFAVASTQKGSVNVSDFVDELHNKLLAKSKEEAGERYDRAIAELAKPGWALRPALIIRLASGKK